MALILDNITYGGLFSSSDTQPYNWLRYEETDRDVTSQWLSDDEITQTLNLYGDTSQEALLLNLDLAARMFVEEFLGRAIYGRSFTAYYKALVFQAPYSSLDIPSSRLDTSIDSVQYFNTASPPVQVTLASSAYSYDYTGQKVILYQNLAGSINSYYTAPVQCNFTLANDPIASYPNVRRAGLLYLTHLYNNRADTTEKTLNYIPAGIHHLLLPYQELII